MKKLTTSFALVLLTAFPLAGFGQTNVEKDPAYLPIDKVIDLKAIRPEVNVNLPRFLLKDALSELNSAGNGSPIAGLDIADLIKDVKLIRVVVIKADHTNRPALDKAMKALRSELEKKWTTIVSVPEDKDHVGVYAMPDPAGESTAGLAILVFDGSHKIRRQPKDQRRGHSSENPGGRFDREVTEIQTESYAESGQTPPSTGRCREGRTHSIQGQLVPLDQ